MLGKLLKYELKDTSHTFLGLYGITLGLSLIYSICISLGFMKSNVLPSVLIVAAICIFVFFALITMIFSFVRFSSNLMGNEGYLMNTLPVTSSQLVLSKLISFIIWSGLGCIVAFLASSILFLNQYTRSSYFMVISEIFSPDFRQVLNMYGSTKFIPLFTIVFITSWILTMLQVYFCTSFSQLELFNWKRIPSAVILFLLINFGFSMLDRLLSKILLNFVAPDNLAPYLICSAVINIAVGVIFFYGCSYILQKKLNLK